MSTTLSRPDENGQLRDLFSLPAQRLDSYIEQLRADDCQTPGIPYLKATSTAKNLAIIFKPRCKSWSCPECGQVNARLWTWRAAAGAAALRAAGPVEFITVTSHEKLDAAGSIRVLPSAWGKLQDRLRRAAPGEYLIIPEGHKNGRIHLHGLFTHDLPKRWWKDNARACGMGYQVDLKEVQSVGGVAAYCSKYLTKTLQFTNFGKGFRRVRTSRAWPKLPELPEQTEWVFSKLEKDVSMADTISALQRQGFNVVHASSSDAWLIIDGE